MSLFSPDSENAKKAFQICVEYINGLPAGQWVKAGTLGSHVSSALCTPGSYNKPVVKLLMSKFDPDQKYVQHHPSLGYQALRSVNQNQPLFPERQDARQEEVQSPVNPGLIQRPSYSLCNSPLTTLTVVSRCGNLAILSDETCTIPAVVDCTHRVLERTPMALSCVMCGLRFLPSKKVSEFFSHPAVMEALSASFSEMKTK